MFLSALLLPLAGATIVLASGSSNSASLQCLPLVGTDYECPIPCKWEPNCNVNCIMPPHLDTKPVHTTFDIFSLVFGFDMPLNYKLCPVGKCEPKACLCRETVLKRLTAFLMPDDGGHYYKEDEKEEL